MGAGRFLSEVVRKDGFEAFEYLLLSILEICLPTFAKSWQASNLTKYFPVGFAGMWGFSVALLLFLKIF